MNLVPPGWTGCRITDADVRAWIQQAAEAVVRLSSQISLEKFKAGLWSLLRSSFLMEKPRPCQQPYQETASPSCTRRHCKKCAANLVRGLFTDTSAGAKLCFQNLSSSPKRWLT